ncbi:DDB1- and CUL4-associated factor 4-like protein 1 [Tubulanus polymorphus]|uniref:DDB1- and CUL4-associated factor 4-like protein 1 n=1 Tax=Tubulanus polymorphus TaxID=672921 RepID=UPI003DA308CC
MPSHLAASSSNVTRESIKREHDEKRRIETLCQMSENRKVTCTLVHHRKLRSSNVVDSLIERRRLGFKMSDGFKAPMIRARVPFMNTTLRRKVFPEPANMYEVMDHMHTMQPSSDYTKILGLWSVRTTAVQRIQVLDLSPTSKFLNDSSYDSMGNESRDVKIETEIGIKPSGTAIMKSLSKVTHICWAPLSVDDRSNSAVLYTTMCILGRFPSLALFRRLDSSTVQEYRSTEFNLGKNAAWTCAWNSYNQQFSIGSEKKAILIDVETRRLWELNTRDGDVLTQIFSNQEKSLLYSGTRKGLVCCHDLRSSSTYYVSALVHESSVCCIQLLKDENYIICSTFSGRIQCWDLRMRKVVQEFPGHVNEYSRIPFHIDSTETVLCAAGQDCYTRIWSLKDSTLLHTIPPPFPASRDIIPAIRFSTEWARSSQAGLLMGIKDEIHFYSL